MGPPLRHSRTTAPGTTAPRGCRTPSPAELPRAMRPARLDDTAPHPAGAEAGGHAHPIPEAAVEPCWTRRGTHPATPRKERGQVRSVVEAPGSLLVGAVLSRVFLARSPDSPRIGRRVPVCACPRCFSRATTVLVHRSAPVRNGRGRLRLLVLIASTRIHGLRPPASGRHLTGPVPRARDFTPSPYGTSATRHLRVPEALLVVGDLTPGHAAHTRPRPPLRLYLGELRLEPSVRTRRTCPPARPRIPAGRGRRYRAARSLTVPVGKAPCHRTLQGAW